VRALSAANTLNVILGLQTMNMATVMIEGPHGSAKLRHQSNNTVFAKFKQIAWVGSAGQPLAIKLKQCQKKHRSDGVPCGLSFCANQFTSLRESIYIYLPMQWRICMHPYMGKTTHTTP